MSDSMKQKREPRVTLQHPLLSYAWFFTALFENNRTKNCSDNEKIKKNLVFSCFRQYTVAAH